MIKVRPLHNPIWGQIRAFFTGLEFFANRLYLFAYGRFAKNRSGFETIKFGPQSGLCNGLTVLFILISVSLFGAEMRNYLPRNALIFDVGAHEGGKTAHYLDLGAARVICIEPQSDCVEILRKKFAHLKKVEIEPIALSDHIGAILFYPSPASTISTADLDWQEGRFKGWVWNEAIEVQATTLDALIEKYGLPDFCKIDVEGYELHVLKGMTKPIPYLNFEFTAEYLEKKTKACLEYLSAMGYKKFNAAFDNTERFVFPRWLDWKELLIEIKKNPDPLFWGDIYAKF